jgi:hypothetical protein
MPLHAEGEAVVVELERLGQLVHDRPAGGDEALAESVDALVMVRLRGVEDLARRTMGERALGQAHVVVGVVEGAQRAAVLVMAVALGQVLQQRPAAGDVHELHSAADAEQRDAALHRAACERDLEDVALGHRPARLGVRLRPVGTGVDVGPAGQDQPVDDVEQLVGVIVDRLVGRHHDHEPARRLDGADVGPRQQERLLVPDAPACALEHGADADHGAGHRRSG